MTTWTDPIIDEIHAIREKMAKDADYDFDKFIARIRKAEQQHPERLVDKIVPEPRLSKAAREAQTEYGENVQSNAPRVEQPRPWSDPILDEIHAIREQMAKEADYDVHKYVEQLRESEKRRSEKNKKRPSEEQSD